jgi:hypothetical protein
VGRSGTGALSGRDEPVPPARPVAALRLPAHAEADAEPVSELTGPTPVATYAGVTAWSERDPAAGTHHLVYRVGDGAPARVPVAPRGVPFDVTLGPGPDGGVVAAYSRCRQEPEVRRSTRPLPAHATGRGCDLYAYDFRAGAERRLDGPSTGAASETMPAVWRDEVAFVRVFERRSGLRGRAPYIYVRSLEGGEPSRRQPGGARGSTGLPGPLSLDLYGRRLSFPWIWERRDGGVSEMRMVTVDRTHRLVRSTGWRSSVARYMSPHTSHGRVFFGLQRSIERGGSSSSLGSELLRYRISTGRLDVSSEPSPFLVSTARDRGSELTLAVRSAEPRAADGCGEGCRLERLTDLTWRFRRVIPPPSRVVIRYSVERRGDVRADFSQFRRQVGDTLADDRGWSLGGSLAWRRASSGTDVRVILASPSAVERAAPACSRSYSCRVGDQVLINDRRWRRGADPWPRSLRDYRHYVVNHEVGHWLGLGDVNCPRQGRRAPVMVQQSISLEGCEANPWPLASERRRVAREYDVRVR